ncbi:MAG: hypothetical protein LBQ02_03200 [Candidatus Nomurabacteria bacterium]|nr:hypothetical protein [Candidatus Nomurabacteria bacterium]
MIEKVYLAKCLSYFWRAHNSVFDDDADFLRFFHNYEQNELRYGDTAREELKLLYKDEMDAVCESARS